VIQLFYGHASNFSITKHFTIRDPNKLEVRITYFHVLIEVQRLRSKTDLKTKFETQAYNKCVLSSRDYSAPDEAEPMIPVADLDCAFVGACL